MKHSDSTKPDPNDPQAQLDQYFKSARDLVPQPDADFMQRVLDQIPIPQTGLNTADDPVPHRPWWQQIFSEIGGWPTITGLATAGIVGIWIGMTGNNIWGLPLDQFQASADFIDPFIGYDLSYIEG